MKKREISLATDPDAHPSGHSKKRALLLFAGAITACWAAMELCKAFSVTVPLPVLLVIHSVGFLGLVLIYRWMQLRVQGAVMQ